MKHVTLLGGEVVPSMGQGTWKMGERAERRSDEIAALRAGVELASSRVFSAGLRKTLRDRALMHFDFEISVRLGGKGSGVKDAI
jgi:hypothetical protein